MQPPVPYTAPVRQRSAAQGRSPTLKEAEGLVVDVAYLAASYSLRRLNEEVRHTSEWLLDEKHEGQHSVAPYDQEDAVEHSPILLLS
jgi:hypothetical protein